MKTNVLSTGVKCIASCVLAATSVQHNKWGLFKNIVRGEIRKKRIGCNSALKKEYMGKTNGWQPSSSLTMRLTCCFSQWMASCIDTSCRRRSRWSEGRTAKFKKHVGLEKVTKQGGEPKLHLLLSAFSKVCGGHAEIYKTVEKQLRTIQNLHSLRRSFYLALVGK